MATFVTRDPQDWSAIRSHYDALLGAELAPEMVPSWLRQWSDLVKAVWETQAILHRDTTRDLTDDRAREAEKAFGENVLPGFEAANQSIRLKLLSLEDYLPAPEHMELIRRWRNEADLYRVANAALQADISPLETRYMAIDAALTVVVAGQELTALEVQQRLQSPDRAIREATWRARRGGWLRQREALNTLFMQQLPLRRQLARNADLPNYQAYRWRELNRLDYTPADALALHAAIEAEIVPLTVRLCEARRGQLGVSTLRPWDAAMAIAQEPLRPFTEITELEAGVARILTRVDEEFGLLFERMQRGGSFDLAPRKEKRFGGECWFAPLTGLPYINMHASGTANDMYTLIHECGHGIHSLLSVGQQELIWNMAGPEDVCEFAAQTMVFLAERYLDTTVVVL